MFTYVVNETTATVVGAICHHQIPAFKEMKRGWRAELDFDEISCNVALYNSNGRCQHSFTGELSAEKRHALLADAEEWKVSAPDGSVTLVARPFAVIPVPEPEPVPEPTPATEPEAALPARVHAYTKGFWEPGKQVAWWEFAILTDESHILKRGQGTTVGDSREIGGELAACMRAVQWAVNNGVEELILHYVTPGAEKWATGVWRTNKQLTIAYAKYMQSAMERVNIQFRILP